MLDHEIGQFTATDENYSVDCASIYNRLLTERCGCDEHALRSVIPGYRSEEGLNLWATDRILPALGLNVDLLKAKAVQGDDAIDPSVARAPNSHEIRPTRAVSHLVQQVKDDRFEVLRGADAARKLDQYAARKVIHLQDGYSTPIDAPRSCSLFSFL